jgi:hypothetical protein
VDITHIIGSVSHNGKAEQKRTDVRDVSMHDGGIGILIGKACLLLA